MSSSVSGPPVPVYPHDLFSDEVLRDSAESYRDLRGLGPLVWLEAHDMYMFPRFAEVRAALRDSETFRSGEGVGLNDVVNKAFSGNSTLMTDGKAHEYKRNLLFGPLTPKALVPIRERVQAIADEIVDELVIRARFDAVADLARALPLTVVPDLVGWPEHGREHLLTWAAATFDALGPMNDRARNAAPNMEDLFAFASQTVREGDLLPGGVGACVLEAVDRGELDLDQVAVLIIDYLAPSMDTTISGIGSAIWLLATHPDQWQDVRADPGLIPRAFNEVLRLETPVRCFTRVTTTEVTIGEHTLPAGARVVLHYGSANRDERQFENPDQFDIHRENVAAQLAFGVGTHNCAGQGLARLEAHAMLAALAARVDKILLDGDPVRTVNNLINAFTSMPVRLTPSDTASKPETVASANANTATGCPVAHPASVD